MIHAKLASKRLLQSHTPNRRTLRRTLDLNEVVNYFPFYHSAWNITPAVNTADVSIWWMEKASSVKNALLVSLAMKFLEWASQKPKR